MKMFQKKERSCRKKRTSTSKGNLTSLNRKTSKWKRRKDRLRESSTNWFQILATCLTGQLFKVMSCQNITLPDKYLSKLRKSLDSSREIRAFHRKEVESYRGKMKLWRLNYGKDRVTWAHPGTNNALTCTIKLQRTWIFLNLQPIKELIASKISTAKHDWILTSPKVHLSKNWKKLEHKSKLR